MSSSLSTDVVAWYGAVLATLVFAFELWKWVNSRARLRITIAPNTWYPDSDVLKVTKTEHGEQRELRSYFHIEVSNIGAMPTTILSIEATTAHINPFERWIENRKSRHFRGVISYAGGAFTPHEGKKLPHVLGPGEVWSCRVGEDGVYSLLQGGTPKLALRIGSLSKPIYKPFPLAANHPLHPTPAAAKAPPRRG